MIKKCPLCHSICETNKIFESENNFISVGEVSLQSFNDLENGSLKKYGRGTLKISLVQCEQCGYVYNEFFDQEKMFKAYGHSNYITPKIISKTMSKTIRFLTDKIKSYSNKEDIFLEIAPGSCDLLLSLSETVKHIYAIDISSDIAMLNRDNISFVKKLFSYDELKSVLVHDIDFIVFRHLIEHIFDVRPFLEDVVKLLRGGGLFIWKHLMQKTYISMVDFMRLDMSMSAIMKRV